MDNFDLSQFLNEGIVHNEKKKNETYENFIYSFKKCFTWNAIQNSFIHKKTFSCEKVYRSFGLTL